MRLGRRPALTRHLTGFRPTRHRRRRRPLPTGRRISVSVAVCAAAADGAPAASVFKSRLNDLCQERRLPLPAYEARGSLTVWAALCTVHPDPAAPQDAWRFEGAGRSKKEAEGEAARRALAALEPDERWAAAIVVVGGAMAAAIQQGLPGCAQPPVTMDAAVWPDNYLPSDADLRTALAGWLGGTDGAGEPSAGLLLALRTALVHPACGPHNYRRLAFVGDAILKARTLGDRCLAAAARRGFFSCLTASLLPLLHVLSTPAGPHPPPAVRPHRWRDAGSSRWRRPPDAGGFLAGGARSLPGLRPAAGPAVAGRRRGRRRRQRGRWRWQRRRGRQRPANEG